jgi:hypothetical protein
LWKLAVSQRVASIPAWVIVVAVAAIVGGASAVVAVVGVSRWRNRSAPPLEVPVSEASDG